MDGSKEMILRNFQVCTKCVYNQDVPQISFDESGECNYCKQHKELCIKYPDDSKGETILKKIFDEIKRKEQKKKYDCIVGVSGGCDSSFLLVKCVEYGLKPLAVHFDNTWNSKIATQNIKNLLDKLKIDLITHVVDAKEYEDIIKSFLLSGTKNLDAAYDIGLASVLYRTAEKFNLKYIIDGHSFRTEGIAPLDWSYMDGKYISSIHKKYGKIKMKTYPNLSLVDFIRYTAVRRIKRIRPLYYIKYPKEKVKKMLTRKYNWKWYDGHHLENIFTNFFVNYVLINRWKNDLRLLGHAALVRTGQLSREKALKELEKEPICNEEIVEVVKKRLNLNDEDLGRLMVLPKKTWRDFKTYKKTFENLRPFFYVLFKLSIIPESFYIKFCFPLDKK